MSLFRVLTARLSKGAALAVIGAAMAGILLTACATNKTDASAKKKLSGGDLYSIHCSRCHAERYATEYNAMQWKTLVMHMRVRANVPEAQAKEIVKYLGEDAGN